MIYKVTFHLSTLYIYQILSTQELPQETRKIEYMNSFYIQETSYTKLKDNTA